MDTQRLGRTRQARLRVRVSDLKDQHGMSFPWPILYCVNCGVEYSANKRDYFAASPDYIFRHCGKPMRLVVKREVYESVPVSS